MDAADKKILCEGKHLRFVARAGWEYAERKKVSGIVGIVALTEDGKLLLVEQFRPPLQKRVIELPAGLAGDVAGSENEALAEAAKRELLEETGYSAREMERLAEGPASAGICDEVLTLFRAKGIQRVTKGGGDGSEDIIVHEVPLPEVPTWLAQRQKEGLAVDLKVYAGLYFLP